MGGSPLFGLNIAGWNDDELPLDLLEEVLAGAGEAARRGGWVLAGGHTFDDPEPKFGVAVVGLVDPDRILRVSGFREGDALVLTKALGVGDKSTAIKRGAAAVVEVAAAVDSMTRPNEEAARAALETGATGATDVTGFGLLGHLRNAMEASRVDAEVEVSRVPILPGARALAEDGAVPGGTRRNLDWAREGLDAGSADDVTLLLLADAQTSGGLLFGTDPAQADRAVDSLVRSGHDAAQTHRPNPVFPSMVCQMISVGESTGALDNMLNKIADFYDDEVDAAVGALTALMEPMLMVFLGVVIGGLVVAMYLPIFKIAGAVGG
jgi:selenide, water dikinase